MTYRVLVAAPRMEWRDDIKNSLVDAFDDLQGDGDVHGLDSKPLCVEVGSLSDAMQHMEADGAAFELVVTSLQMPADGRSQRDDSANLGMRLARDIREMPDVSANLVLVARYDSCDAQLRNLMAEASGLEKVNWLLAGQDPVEVLRNVIRKRLRAGQPRAAPAKEPEEELEVMVEIDLAADLPSYYIYLGGRLVQKDILKNIDEVDFNAVEELSSVVWKEDDWIPKMRLVGNLLYRVLLERNPAFLSEVMHYAQGQADKVHYCFALNRRTYQILCEALVPAGKKGESDVRDFWMLKTPLTRRLSIDRQKAEAARQRFVFRRPSAEREPLNCLIIKADVAVGEPFRAGGTSFPALSKLRNVSNESRWLEMMLEEQKKRGGPTRIGKIEMIDASKVLERAPAATNCTGFLKEHLSQTPWHIIHFAGHSWYEEDYVDPQTGEKGRGWLFLEGLGGKRVEPITAEDFAGLWATRPELIYLSSCHSSQDDMVFELGRKEIPAIIGYRWDIDDDQAFEHAKAFYTELLSDGGRVEGAFLKARQAIFQESRKMRALQANKSWAAATLVLEQ